MADENAATSKAASASSSSSPAAKPSPNGNPVFRMMGLPNLRPRLPSRNWTIFWTLVGTWTAALLYDRREKRRVQRKWAGVVAYIAREPLSPHEMPRKLTVYLAAQPADGLLASREHFHEYVKPILVAAALDWDAVEGRREGDIRAGLAERIRKARRAKGERGAETAEEVEEGNDLVVARTRERMGIREYDDGPPGDIVIGRNTWKEYVRGLHEGWLGPLDPPPPEEKLGQEIPTATSAPAEDEIHHAQPEQTSTIPLSTPTDTSQDPISQLAGAGDDVSPTSPPTPPPSSSPKEEASKPEETPKSPKRKRPPPYITPSVYSSSALSPNCPPELPPVSVIPFPHILGFFNTPTRMYRFLNRRHIADRIGRETAAAVLGVYRPFSRRDSSTTTTSTLDSAFSADDASPSPPSSQPAPFGIESPSDLTGAEWEQSALLASEEKEWHKSVRQQAHQKQKQQNNQPAGGEERIWAAPMVLDPRMAERMCKFELRPEDEKRAEKEALESEKERTAQWWRAAWERLPGRRRGERVRPGWEVGDEEEWDDER